MVSVFMAYTGMGKTDKCMVTIGHDIYCAPFQISFIMYLEYYKNHLTNITSYSSLLIRTSKFLKFVSFLGQIVLSSGGPPINAVVFSGR